jgi:uncharacterized protein YqcC (DUF446 family)
MVSCAADFHFDVSSEVSMTHHDRVRQRLHAIEAQLRAHQHWQDNAPDASVFASTQPFFMDTMEPLEWLQWVLLPRMHQLIDDQQPLPQNVAIAPYYEMALDASHPFRVIIMPELEQLDALFAGDDA